jgi:hypothetical protein
MPEQNCPLCNGPAKFKHEAYGRSNKCFNCSNCLLFIISPKAEEFIKDAPNELKKEISDKSKLVDLGKALLITEEKGKEDWQIINPYIDCRTLGCTSSLDV